MQNFEEEKLNKYFIVEKTHVVQLTYISVKNAKI